MELVTDGDKTEPKLDRAQGHILLDILLDAGFDASLHGQLDRFWIRVEGRNVGAVQLHNLAEIVLDRGNPLAVDGMGRFEIG